MDVDDDDDFYADERGAQDSTEEKPKAEDTPQSEVKQDNEDLEEGEEEDEVDSDDSDIDIITERKDGTTAAGPGSRYNQAPPSRNAPTEAAVAKPTTVKKESSAKAASKIDLPGISFSKIDVDAKPIYEPAGKPITEINIDEDLPDNDKPWRRPGADVSDYFNYGFDEFTWALYASKQGAIRSEFDQDKMAQNQKKMMEDMSMMMMGGMPGMGGAAGMEGMPPEMQQMMQQMMAGGMDPSQMDPAAMFGGGGAQPSGPGFGGQGGFGQGQDAQMGYGYNQGGGGGGGGANRGNYGRGRGGRGRW